MHILYIKLNNKKKILDLYKINQVFFLIVEPIMIIKKHISYMDRNELVIVFYNSFKYYFLIVVTIKILLLYSILTSSFPDSEFK